jgi:hypothetical protein
MGREHIRRRGWSTWEKDETAPSSRCFVESIHFRFRGEKFFSFRISFLARFLSRAPKLALHRATSSFSIIPPATLGSIRLFHICRSYRTCIASSSAHFLLNSMLWSMQLLLTNTRTCSFDAAKHNNKAPSWWDLSSPQQLDGIYQRGIIIFGSACFRPLFSRVANASHRQTNAARWKKAGPQFCSMIDRTWRRRRKTRARSSDVNLGILRLLGVY